MPFFSQLPTKQSSLRVQYVRTMVIPTKPMEVTLEAGHISPQACGSGTITTDPKAKIEEK